VEDGSAYNEYQYILKSGYLKKYVITTFEKNTDTGEFEQQGSTTIEYNIDISGDIVTRTAITDSDKFFQVTHYDAGTGHILSLENSDLYVEYNYQDGLLRSCVQYALEEGVKTAIIYLALYEYE
jgi:hypothetical protein